MTSPLRGPESPEEGGFAAAHLLARRARYPGPPLWSALRKYCRTMASSSPEDSASPACPDRQLTGFRTGQLSGCGRAERSERGCSRRFHPGG